MIPLLVAPVVLLAVLSFVHWIAALPFLIWAAICLGYGASDRRCASGSRVWPLAGLSAMVMHFAWSLGFWIQLMAAREASPHEEQRNRAHGRHLRLHVPPALSRRDAALARPPARSGRCGRLDYRRRQ